MSDHHLDEKHDLHDAQEEVSPGGRRESHAHAYGTNVELERNFSFLSCLGLAFAMLNSWNAM